MASNEQGQYVNEGNLDSLQPAGQQDRNILQMQYSININTVNPFIFMDHAYEGSAGFRDGSYLIPFSRESSYISRKQLAHYKNYLKPILRAMVEPIFVQDAQRKVTTEAGAPIEDSMFNGFIDDCDSAGTYIQDFTHQVIMLSRRHGVSFIVMDNFPTTAQPETIALALDGRIYPYVYAKRAYEVEDYQCDAFGNLTEITFSEAPAKIVSNGTVSMQCRWRRWTQTESIVLTKSKNDKNQWIEISRATHGLGRVPVIMVFSVPRECNSKILVDPPLYDIAKLNYVIFNQSAEIRDQERAQAFSIFFCQGVPPGDLVISNNTYINLPDSATISPGYASPDFNIVTGLVANQEQIRKDLYTIAEQNGVVGVQGETSGIAKSYDFEAREGILKQTSHLASTAEEAMADLFELYTKEKFEYSVNYPMDFAPNGVDMEVSRFEKILKIPGLNKTLLSKVQEKLTRMVLADEEDAVVNEVIDSIREDLKEPEPVVQEPPIGETGSIMDPQMSPEMMGATGMQSQEAE